MTVATASLLAVVFAVALRGKVSAEGFGEFRRGVGRLWPGGRLPDRARHALAVVVLAGEAAVTVALIGGTLVPALSPAGFAGAVVLLGAFTAAHAVALRRGAAVACACFGRATTVIGPVGLIRNVVLTLAGVAGLVLALSGPGTPPGVALLPALLTGAVAGLLMVNLEELVDLFRSSTAPARPGRPG